MIIHFTASAGVHLKILLTSYTAWCTLKQDLQSGHSVHAASPRAHKCHCSRVTTSTAWPSNVTVLSMRVATGAMATWTGRLPWARLVTTVWYMLTGIWTKPAEWFDTYYAFKFHLSDLFWALKCEKCGDDCQRTSSDRHFNGSPFAGVSYSRGTGGVSLIYVVVWQEVTTLRRGQFWTMVRLNVSRLASLMAQSAPLPVGITGVCLRPTLQAVNVKRFTAADVHGELGPTSIHLFESSENRRSSNVGPLMTDLWQGWVFPNTRDCAASD